MCQCGRFRKYRRRKRELDSFDLRSTEQHVDARRQELLAGSEQPKLLGPGGLVLLDGSRAQSGEQGNNKGCTHSWH